MGKTVTSRTMNVMQYLSFPSAEQAQAFIQELQASGLGNLSSDPHTYEGAQRNTQGQFTGTTPEGEPIITSADGKHYIDRHGGTADDAGMGAIHGSGAGALAGAATGILATAVTGGLALPFVLGLTALGAGVGAGVGAAGGALGVDETPGTSLMGTQEIQLSEEGHQTIIQTGTEGRTVAVDDRIPEADLLPISQKYGGVTVI